MYQFLNYIWSENLYPAKVKLLKLAREQKPETQPKDVEQFLNSQISYQLLKEAKSVFTTADCWTSRRKSYIAVTVHWYSTDLTRNSACLAVRRIQGNHDYSVLAHHLESIHEEFDITKKTTACITDSASNFIKCFRLFGAKPISRIVTRISTPVQEEEATIQTTLEKLPVLIAYQDRNRRYPKFQISSCFLLDYTFKDLNYHHEDQKELNTP
jgi:hypothetical protein